MTRVWVFFIGLLTLLLARSLGSVEGDAGNRAVGDRNPALVRLGAASSELVADPDMVIGGGIHGRTHAEQEGRLRATAVVVAPVGREIRGADRAALVACDILMIRRDYLDAAARRIEEERGIPISNILVNATHTHHAPTTVTIHGYRRDEIFCGRVRDAIVRAVTAADRQLEKSEPVEMVFRLGIESSVGQNSRVLLDDGTIFWTGDRDGMVRPTGPFDPDLPVIAFRDPSGQAGRLRALIFNHSTHLIGTRRPGVSSPGFYGLLAQDLEKDLADQVLFISGAFGSTHNLTLGCEEMILRLEGAIREALGAAVPVAAAPIRGIRREFTYRVRRFDEMREDAAVSAYCKKRIRQPESVIQVFRNMRRELAPKQGEERRTWIQAVRVGEVALVGVPGEFFTVLGVDIKRRSPFRHTYVAGVANDYIGYIPDGPAYDLGGYQVWTGLHSFVERGTGERMVTEVVRLLEELRR